MKYLVILGDGMADNKIKELGNKTPLEVAYKPNIDAIVKKSELGIVKTQTEKFEPGSDVGNLMILGYDPEKYYTGRSPLEAANIGIEMNGTDIAMRCNLVSLSDAGDYEQKTMLDYSSSEISTAEADVLINYLNEKLSNKHFRFYTGTSYRHCLIWAEGAEGMILTPPHDFSNKKVAEFMPRGAGSDTLIELQKKSFELLNSHPLNIEREKKGLNPANSIWLWGAGKKPSLPGFYEKYGLSASMVSAVDLLKGIGKFAGFNVVDVEGATGNIHTNFGGKASAVIEEFENGQDFVFIHVEAPDECAHQGDLKNKIKAIEIIDDKIVGPLYDYLKDNLNNKGEHFNIMVLPDHQTSVESRTHTSVPVPYMIYRSDEQLNNKWSYNEENALKTGIFITQGHKLIDKFINKTIGG